MSGRRGDFSEYLKAGAAVDIKTLKQKNKRTNLLNYFVFMFSCSFVLIIVDFSAKVC